VGALDIFPVVLRGNWKRLGEGRWARTVLMAALMQGDGPVRIRQNRTIDAEEGLGPLE